MKKKYYTYIDHTQNFYAISDFFFFLVEVFVLLTVIEVFILSPLFLFIRSYDLGKYEEVTI